MICMDPPMTHYVPALRREAVCVHLFSDRTGAEGTAELVAFAERLGLKRRWIQHEGTYKEHFDVMGRARIDAAIALGATALKRADAVAVWRQKRTVLVGGGQVGTVTDP